MNKTWMGSTAVVTGLLLAATAANAAPANSSASDEPSIGQNTANVGEVVVTAQRRVQKLSEVPETVIALSASQLTRAGVSGLRDLQLVVPGLTFGGTGTQSLPTLRGVGAQPITGGENPIAVYVDGVYQLNSSILREDMPDMQDLQVLKGPQGVLFGRNSSAGAVLVTTRAPSFNFSGNVSALGGYYTGSGGSHAAPEVGINGFVTGPLLGNVLAGSLAAGYDYTPGYLTDDVTGQQTGVIRKYYSRAKLLLEPTDWTKFTLAGWYIWEDDQGQEGATSPPGWSPGDYFPGSITAHQPFHVSYDPGYLQGKVETKGISFNAEFKLAFGTITSITALNHTHAEGGNSVSFTHSSPACFTSLRCIDITYWQIDSALSQEINFTSRKINGFTFVGGVFYYNASVWNPSFTQNAPRGTYLIKNQDYAVYGDLTWDVTDRLTIEGGLRYTSEPRQDRHYANAVNVDPADVPTSYDRFRTKTYNSLAPRASIRYRFLEGLNGYFTYSEGSRSGTTGVTNTVTNPPFQPVLPEVVRAYEAGLKYASHNLSLNGAFFYYDYQNKQQRVFLGTTTIDGSAGPVRIYGLDVDGVARLNNDFTLSAAVSWLPVAKFLDYPKAPGFTYARFAPTTTTVIGAGGVPVTCTGFCPGFLGSIQATFNATGMRVDRAPELTLSSTLAYNHEFDPGTVDASVTVHYSSAFNADLTGMFRQPGYATLAAQAGILLRNSKIRVSVWGRNLTNSIYMTQTLTSASGFAAYYGAPREVGVRVDYKW